MTGSFHRRDVLTWGAGLGGMAMTSPVLAQLGETVDMFGVPVPKLLIDKVKFPSKSLNMVRTIAAIVELEKQAMARGLPYSPLEAVKPPPLVPVEGGFYQSAMPRLVALIDKSEGRDPETAEKAGALLADIHASVHVTPDVLKPTPFIPSTARNFAALKDEYAMLFTSATVRPDHKEAVDWQVKMIIQSRKRYEAVALDLMVPWYFIGAIHGLEASFNFRAHLHNGDHPLDQRTRQVPAGRPLVWLPPADWESSAKDAIKLLGFANQADWSLERTLYRLEAFNGFGYRGRKVPTPYLWCFSNHYDRGKFVSDGSWNAEARSRQCGAAVLLRALVDAKEVVLG